MVTITVENGLLNLELSPMHNLLAFKASLDIPLDAIDSVEKAPEIARAGPDGTRNPGTSIPFLIYAGSFNSGVERTFWDVHNPDNAITIKLKSPLFAGMADRYDRFVVEVADPAATIHEIERALVDSKRS